ncbi:MAG TPA: hypothetical protein VLA45_11560 [Paracoccaceae bacterium]|nr:hypothetical protein [Paracoccaceae bacterium]
MERSAAVYSTNGKLIVAPVIKTTAGIGLEVDPTTIEDASNIAAIGNCLCDALSRSMRIIPHPAQDQWKGFFEPFQKAAGVRSYKAFMKEAIRIGIRESGTELELTPHRNRGSKEGFEEIPDAAIVLAASDYEGAANALIRLLRP